MKILKPLIEKKSLISISLLTVICFAPQYYILKHLPGEAFNSCMIGAYFTAGNISFALIISILIAINFISMGIVIKSKKEFKVLSASLSGSGFFLALLTSLCLPCTLPLITLLGVSISLNFVTDNLMLFKAISLILLIINFYILEKQYIDECQICNINNKSDCK
jgi:hypothetical protein